MFGTRWGLPTRIERADAATVIYGAGVWLRSATALGPFAPPLPLALAIGALVLSVPWWAHRRRRARVRVERKLQAWPDIARAIGLAGSQVMSATVDVWGWRARFRLARGQTITDVVARIPLQGFRRWAPAPPVSRRHRQPATGPPGSYPDRTHTGKRRRAYEREEHHGTTSRCHLPLCWAHERSRLDGFGSADCLTFKRLLGAGSLRGYLVTVPEFPRGTLKISGKVTGSSIVTLRRLLQIVIMVAGALAPDAAIDLVWTLAYAVGSRENGKHDDFVRCRDQP